MTLVYLPYEIRIDCDGEHCAERHGGLVNHEHELGSSLAPGGDPRMSKRLDGWALDIEGKDYCPECKGDWRE